MAPSLLKTVAVATVAFTAHVHATKSYQVSEVYNSTNFFEKFDFYTGTDPNGGYVQYQSQSNAQNLGLVEYQDGEVYIGVDHTNGDYSPSGVGRKSVRLESKNVYNHGLVIADFTHLPKPVCGSWPAFWFFGEPWPTKGEIDIYENWNDLTFNRHTAHVNSPDVVGDCTLVSDDMTSTIDSSNCYDFSQGQYDYQGCSASEYSTNFGSSSGGIYAMEWTSDYLKIWDWSRTAAPADILNGNPSPSLAWGTPTYMIQQCNIDEAFKDMNMVLNVDFCAVAGQPDKWGESCEAKTGYATCPEYVAKKNDDFADANFKIKDIKIYQLEDVQTSSSTSSTISSTSSSTSTISTASSNVSSTTLSTSSVSTTSSSISFTNSTSASISSSVGSYITGTLSFSNATASGLSSTTLTGSNSVSVTTASSASYSTASTASDDDSCTDDNEGSSSSYAASSTASVSVTTTESSGNSLVTSSAYFTSGKATPTTPFGNSSYVVFSSSSEAPEYTTSTIYTTSVHTITSCAPTVTNCPARGYVTTEIISIGTTVCPVTASGLLPEPTATASASEGFTTSTVEVTKVYTITSCKPTVTNCPVGVVTTEVSTTTTVCPIGSASPSSGPGKSAGNTGAASKPVESASVASTPETEITVPNGASTPYPSATDSAATPSAAGSGSETNVLVTATVYPLSSGKASYNATLTSSVASLGGAAETGSTGASSSGLVEVSGGVKFSASFALAGVAAFFFFAM
ncbi:hypothetical protein F4804DRAFT_298619 [Jackrogersella minutella]|nr:hypothetical protein F4804DRAFT_298619 [Jackrogersella minutella]